MTLMHYLALYLYWQSRRMMIGRFGYDDCPTLEEQLRCNLSLCASWTFLKSHSGKNLNTCSLTASTTSTHSTNKITVDAGKSRKGAIKLTICFRSAVAVYRVPVFISVVLLWHFSASQLLWIAIIWLKWLCLRAWVFSLVSKCLACCSRCH